MVTIVVPDRETEKRALAFMLGHFSGRVLRSGEHVVPEAALEALTEEDRSREAETKPGQSGGPNGSVNHGFGGRLGQRFIN